MRKITLLLTSIIVFTSGQINAKIATHQTNIPQVSGIDFPIKYMCSDRTKKTVKHYNYENNIPAVVTLFIGSEQISNITDSFPVITCSSDIITDNELGVCGAVVNFDDATAVDAEDGTLSTIQTMGLVSGSVFPIGDTILEFSATDSDGNTSTCQFTVTVNDVENPIVVCQDISVELQATGHATVDINDLLYSVDENCDYTVVLGDGIATTCDWSNPSNAFENGNSCLGASGRAVANDVTVEANSDFMLNQITANIFTYPGISIVGVDVKYYEDNAGTPGAEIGSELAVAPTSQTVVGNNFDLDVSAVVLDVTPFTFAGQHGSPTTYWIGLSVFTIDNSSCFWETSSASGNGNDTYYNDGSGVWQVQNSGEDGVYIFSGMCEMGTSTTVDFDCSNLGENLVEVAIIDTGGNVASCTATVVVLDVTAPLLVCGPKPLLYGANAVYENPGLEIPDENPAGVSTTINVTDDFTITDLNVPINISHSWRGDLDITLTSPTGTIIVLKSADIDDSEDNVWLTYDDEGTPATEALSVFDGESTLGIWTLFVADQFAFDIGTINSWGLIYEYSYPNPAIDLIIELDADGTVTLEPDDILAVLEEACEIDVMLLDITEFSCEDIETPTLVTIFANDMSGNFASCQVVVHIADGTEPILTCPPDQPIPFDPATGLFILPDYFDIGDAFATDSCTDTSMLMFTQMPPPGSVMGIPMGNPHVITFTAEDEYGNIATCEMELYVHCGVDENELLTNAIAIYPNSATDIVRMVNNSEIALESAMIYDLNGKLVAQIDLQDMQTETTFNVSNFASGVFMVKIIAENASTVKRLIKE